VWGFGQDAERDIWGEEGKKEKKGEKEDEGKNRE
jgi:hypothetical protein